MSYDKDYYTKTVYGGKYKRYTYKAIDAYEEVKDPENWIECPKCKKIPLVWVYNNGRSTACGCGNSRYDHVSVRAESIMSLLNRNNGSRMTYNSQELKENWNHWCETGELLFVPTQERW